MNFFKFINIPVFLISLAIGLFFVYIFDSDKRKIYVYPKPDNVDNIQYKDAAGTCFSVKQEKTECPKDGLNLFNIPPQN